MSSVLLEFFFFTILLVFRVECRHPQRHRGKISNIKDLEGLLAEKSLQLPDEDDENIYDKWYTPWSKWTKCSQKCKQVRRRQCKVPKICSTSILKEERSCTGRKCKSKSFVIVNYSPESTGLDFDNDFFSIVDNIVFTEWTAWSSCSRSCKTRRLRSCMVPAICENEIQRQERFCYIVGSNCERLYGKTEKPGNKSENESIIPEQDVRCGMRNISIKETSLKIVGGRETIRGKWPWQVAILNRYKEPFCGGTLIGSRWVLTAAHCVRKTLYVRVGEYNLKSRDSFETEIEVEYSRRHEDYDLETVDSDIALLKLTEPVRYNKFVLPACLPSKELPVGSKCQVIGWGKDRNSALFGTAILHEAEIPIVDQDVCVKMYEDYIITKNMLCAGYKKGRIDTCAGDSGGPLLCKVDGYWQVYGITSFGEGCGRKGKFGIYTKVSNFLKWINSIADSL